MLNVTLLFRAFAIVEVHGNILMLKKNCHYFKTSCVMGQAIFLLSAGPVSNPGVGTCDSYVN